MTNNPKNKSRLRVLLAPVLLIVSTIAVAASPWNAINGFYPGMSREDALKAGAQSCRYGTQFPESKSNVYCDLPAAATKIGNVTAVKGILEFNAKNLKAVARVQLKFKTDRAEIIRALDSIYGASTTNGLNDSTDTYEWEWHRGGAESVMLSDGIGPRKSTYVVSLYREGMGRARQKARAQDAQKAKTLEAFKK